jgi:predicted transcriptional regulator
MAKERDLEQKKLELIQWVAEASEEYLIDRMLELKNEPNKDWWDEISEEEKAAIEAGLADIEAGRVIPHEEVRKVYEKWLTK